MIDNPAQVDRLLSMLRACLPLAARITPEAAGAVRDQSSGADVPPSCEITRVDYAGDEGGIMCRLECGPEMSGRVVFASITHLRFDGRSALTREIVAYQKHRTKRLRRLTP